MEERISVTLRFPARIWEMTFLGLIGVIVDPTTAGLGDSERAMGYEEPWEDSVNN